MSTATFKTALKRPARSNQREFQIEASKVSPGYNRVQGVARLMVFPSFAVGLMGIAGGLGVGIARGVAIHDGRAPDTIEALRHVQQGLTFLGLAFLLAGISFAIARILGEFRKGGGDIQQAAGRTVEVLRRPLTGWLFLGLMMMAMMTVIGASVAHFVFASDVTTSTHSLAVSDDRFVALAGIERLGIGMYLVAIVSGLATIIHVLRFQAKRVRELPPEPRPEH
jgi:hypothetical protein